MTNSDRLASAAYAVVAILVYLAIATGAKP
jgi:hypothetical protein